MFFNEIICLASFISIFNLNNTYKYLLKNYQDLSRDAEFPTHPVSYIYIAQWDSHYRQVNKYTKDNPRFLFGSNKLFALF